MHSLRAKLLFEIFGAVKIQILCHYNNSGTHEPGCYCVFSLVKVMQGQGDRNLREEGCDRKGERN
jgi:hypothetical protein